MAGGMAQSSPSSGIFFQGQGGNSQLGPNFGNIRANTGPLSGADISNTLLNSIPSSGPSIGGSSLVTDANSRLSAGGPQVQRSASINNEPYMHLPASPMSFTSNNNLNISGSSIMDGSLQQNSIQDGSNPMQKKPRLDVKQEDALQQHVLQQLLQRQDSMPIQGLNPQMQQALIQQQRFRQQQQQYLQNIPPAQRIHFLQQQQQQQLQQQQILQQGNASGLKRPYDGGVCSRRLMQYLYHQRQRPADNTIAYWRKFVAEYYSPRAKKRWCLSLYDNVGHHSLGVFPQASMDAWHCDICGSKSGRGFEATFEVLPRLNEIKFGSGVIDELLFLDMPREIRFPSGMMMLEYAKAVQESVYEQLRVVREGQLRIIFTPDLKIMSWEFCARHHEELLPRRLVAPQVNQLLQVAQKCQNTISENGPEGVSQSDLQANGAMVVNAGRQLARSLESQSLNDLGFSKRYVRCLQIAEVVNSMKDLMDLCKDHKAGPIDGLKNFPRLSTGPKNQMRKGLEMEMQGGQQSSSTDQNTLNKLMALQSSSNSPMNNNQHVFNGQGPMNGSQQSALALSNYQNLMMRQNTMNSNRSSLQHESSSGILSGNLQNSSAQQQFQQHANGNGVSQQNQSLQQQMMQQLIQTMNNKNNGVIPHQQSPSVQNILNQNPGIQNQNQGIINGRPRVNDTAAGNVLNRSDSFKAASGGEPVSRDGFDRKEADLPNNLQLSDDIDHDFMENGFFNNDILDDSMNFGWKA